MFGNKGVQMLLSGLGLEINSEELGRTITALLATAEQYKVAIPQFCHNIDLRVAAMEKNLAAINSKLDLLLPQCGESIATLVLPEEINHGSEHHN